jgi:tRNA nucleotidyltransferase (CCA-adding enzyme)
MLDTVKDFANKYFKCFPVYLVGGGVIDYLCDRIPKDFDIEIYGLSIDEISDILKSNGFDVNFVGASFGIIKTVYKNIDLDISVPRVDNRIGKGHKGFDCSFPSNISPKEASRRRDLTINSIFLDLHTLDIHDPWGGVEDLSKGVLKATDSTTFIEDPLRVLRVMQLLARKGKIVDSDTVDLCISMVDSFVDLPQERVFEELVKLFSASRPSKGLRFLVDSNWIFCFPELESLIGCKQHPEWHPEGDVWEHTLRVVDWAAKEKENLDEDWRLAFMFGALLHDIGKPVVVSDDFTCHGHDLAGEPLTRSFMERITRDKELIDRVVCIVRNHMRCGQLSFGDAKKPGWKRLHNDLRLDVAASLSKCDSLSRYSEEYVSGMEHEPSRVALQYFDEFGKKPIKPVLMGRHLIDAGMKPGPEFGKILKKAYDIQIEDGISCPDTLLRLVNG